jgi:hypothetical protein
MYNEWRPGFHAPFPAFDGVDVTPGAGATVATDTIGGEDFQRVKLIHGVDGTNDGDISTVNGLPTKPVLNTIDFDGSAVGTLFDGRATVGFSSILTLSGTGSELKVRSEFQTTGPDSCVVRVWYKDNNGTTTWSTSSTLYTVNGTDVLTGSGPSGATCLEGSGWYFGETFSIDIRGWTQICLQLTTKPTTAVSMWGDPV